MLVGQGSDRAEMTMGKLVIAVALFTVLVSAFLYYFDKQEDGIHDTGLQAVASVFSAQLLVIRSQWMMDKKPDVVLLRSSLNNQDKQEAITVNENGWVDVGEKSNVCEEIWSMVMDRPLAFFNMPIGAVLLHKKQTTFGHHCRYIVKNGDYFEYMSASGEINTVLKRD